MMPDYRRRRSIRLKNFDYSTHGAYFITICSEHRACFFGKIETDEMQLSATGDIARRCWMNIPVQFKSAEIDEYVLMPNHFHAIVFLLGEESDSINQTQGGVITQTQEGLMNQTPTVDGAGRDWILMKCQKLSLGKIIRHFKAKASKLIHDSSEAQFAWQRNYYEHIIRDDHELDRIREYIRTNPLKWQWDRENPCSEQFDMDVETYFDGVLEFGRPNK
jgi:REP element-mobilizing transposase RayT